MVSKSGTPGADAYKVKGTDKKVTFGQVALTAYVPHNYPLDKLEPGLNETAFYDPTNFTFPAGTYICEVEVDPQTGVVRVDRFTAVDDFGTIINPWITAVVTAPAEQRIAKAVAPDHVIADVAAKDVLHLEIGIAQGCAVLRETQIQRQRDLTAQPEVQRVDIGAADKDIGRVFVSEERIRPPTAVYRADDRAAGADIAVISIAHQHIAFDRAAAVVDRVILIGRIDKTNGQTAVDQQVVAIELEDVADDGSEVPNGVLRIGVTVHRNIPAGDRTEVDQPCRCGIDTAGVVHLDGDPGGSTAGVDLSVVDQSGIVTAKQAPVGPAEAAVVFKIGVGTKHPDRRSPDRGNRTARQDGNPHAAARKARGTSSDSVLLRSDAARNRDRTVVARGQDADSIGRGDQHPGLYEKRVGAG